MIMYGAMQGVPKELYEAARVDGAGPLARFFDVTVPMISPAIFFNLLGSARRWVYFPEENGHESL